MNEDFERGFKSTFCIPLSWLLFFLGMGIATVATARASQSGILAAIFCIAIASFFAIKAKP